MDIMTWQQELCRSVGLNPNEVAELTIQCRAGEFPLVLVRMARREYSDPPPPMKRFRLEPITNSTESGQE
jgi:hypothetical protein